MPNSRFGLKLVQFHGSNDRIIGLISLAKVDIMLRLGWTRMELYKVAHYFESVAK